MNNSDQDTASTAAALGTNAKVALDCGKIIQLPAPRKKGGQLLIDALTLRRSTREYSSRELPPQILSNLLWAGFGVNRPNGDHTAPYWRHIMVIDVYAAMADGLWRYDPERHALSQHLPADIRTETGTQEFVGSAPVNLIYVAHGERMSDILPDEQRLYASVDAAFIGQNVNLFCAAEGLATVFRGSVDRDKLARTMQLAKDQFVTFAQTVGYRKS